VCVRVYQAHIFQALLFRFLQWRTVFYTSGNESCASHLKSFFNVSKRENVDFSILIPTPVPPSTNGSPTLHPLYFNKSREQVKYPGLLSLYFVLLKL